MFGRNPINIFSTSYNNNKINNLNSKFNNNGLVDKEFHQRILPSLEKYDQEIEKKLKRFEK